MADIVRSYGVTQFARRPLDALQNNQRFRVDTPAPTGSTLKVRASSYLSFNVCQQGRRLSVVVSALWGRKLSVVV